MNAANYTWKSLWCANEHKHTHINTYKQNRDRHSIRAFNGFWGFFFCCFSSFRCCIRVLFLFWRQLLCRARFSLLLLSFEQFNCLCVFFLTDGIHRFCNKIFHFIFTIYNLKALFVFVFVQPRKIEGKFFWSDCGFWNRENSKKYFQRYLMAVSPNSWYHFIALWHKKKELK